jgi:hypothetical protein
LLLFSAIPPLLTPMVSSYAMLIAIAFLLGARPSILQLRGFKRNRNGT